ncbi:MAG: caspase family protein [Zavarzinella sp.]
MSRLALLVLLIGIATITFDSTNHWSTYAQVKGKKKKGIAKIPEPKPEDIKEDTSRVLPVFDPGSHTQAISAMGFSKDNSKLITVGQDFTVQVWSSSTGERLDVLRLPGYGREKGYDAGRWDVAAVSADGNLVAIGGQMKLLSSTGDDRTGRLVIVDVVKRTVNRVQIRTGLNRPVTALAFSPDGEMLAISIETGPKENPVLMMVGDLKKRIKTANPMIRTTDCHQTLVPRTINKLAFSPDGQQLLMSDSSQKISIWEIPRVAAPQAKLVKELLPELETLGLAWSPDGRQFAYTVKTNTEESRIRGFDIRSADGTLVKPWRIPDLTPPLGKGFVTIFGIQYLDAQTIFVAANGGLAGAGGGTIPVVVDLVTGKSRQLSSHQEGMVNIPVCAATTDGKLVAYTVTGNTEVIVSRPDGTAQIRCGQRSPAPYYLGWSKNPSRPGFAWNTGDIPKGRLQDWDTSGLKQGFDLTTMEPIANVVVGQYDTARFKHGEWSIKNMNRGAKAPDDGFRGLSRLMQGEKAIAGIPVGADNAHTLIPNGDQPPLVALRQKSSFEGPDVGQIYKSDGTLLTQVLPYANMFSYMASSPDGRFLICTTGTPRIVIYRTDGSQYPLLSFAQLNGEWVCWTPEGYYAASPGGEKLFGWAINNGQNSLVSFHPAEKFAKQFRRPDIIKLAIEKGSVQDALLSLSVKPADQNNITLPQAKLTLVSKTETKVILKAEAWSSDKEKPVLSMRVFLDGRPIADGKGDWSPAINGSAEATFELDIPTGERPFEFRLFVRNAQGSNSSEPVMVIGKPEAANSSKLYRLCIGINEYQNSITKLNAATKDAKDIFESFASNCVGQGNLFGVTGGELILDQDATRDRILQEIKKARKATKPGDLLVIFFAGHGVKQVIPGKDDEEEKSDYFLLTYEANTQKDLTGCSLSGSDLQKALADIECPVLLLLDACHSAEAIKSLHSVSATRQFRSATDDLTRTMIDERVGVTVMSAAMSREQAFASRENGHFTAALLKGLKVEEGVHFNRYERQLYVNQLYNVVHDEVRHATQNAQTPVFNMPWFSQPFGIRKVLAK